MSCGARLPWRLRRPVRRARNALAAGRALVRALPRLRAIARTPPRRTLAVSYGHERMASPRDVVLGGAVKFHVLARTLPHAPRDFNVLYLGSTWLPIDAAALVRLARRRGAVFAWNQNGVAYPAWHGPGWELVNAPRARLLHRADHVFFQTAFCKVGADRFYGERDGSWEVLPNPVDTEAFTPGDRPDRPLTLLLGGSQYQAYRVETALRTLAGVRSERPGARLLVAGGLTFAPDAAARVAGWTRELGLEGAVELVGPYAREDAPELMRRADLLVHTKYNDPCPTVVLEAMASGLPVAYSASGGVPELVGDDAGIGVPAPLDWERDHPPDPAELAAAVLALADRLPERAAAARDRSLLFDARPWIDRHVEVFADLSGRPAGIS